MGQLGSDIHDPAGRFEGIEVLRITLPSEVDSLGQNRLGNVFDTLHQVDEVTLAASANRSETYTTVSKYGGGNAVPRRRCHVGIPRRLAVVVGVDVHPSREHQVALGIDRPRC